MEMAAGSLATHRGPWRRRLSMAQDAALLVITSLFVYSHAHHAITERSLSGAFFATEQALLAGIFLTRRRTDTTSTRPWDWFVATVGGWLAMAVRTDESGGSLEAFGTGLQIFGIICVFAGFAALGKSFGVVAANRGLKTYGPYRLVRHPIYFAHTMTLTGFVLANWTPWNMTILLVVTLFQVLRIHAEERVLSSTSDYAGYARQVRWRLFPGIY